MDAINTTIPMVEPLAITIKNLMHTIEIFVGGLFGIYVIAFIYRIVTFGKLSRQMKKLFEEMEKVKERLIRLEKKRK